MKLEWGVPMNGVWGFCVLRSVDEGSHGVA
jgi:hypothetical protein